MRSRGLQFIIAGILCSGLLACHPPKPAAPQRLPVEPPPGWRIGQQRSQRNQYAVSFVPKQRTSQEKMWVSILRKPELISKPIDELLADFQPHFICKSRDLSVLKKTANDLLFEEKDSICYGKSYRYTIGRITRGKGTVSYYAYRADVKELPGDRRDMVLKALSTAPLDTSGAPAASPSESANPAPSAASTVSP